MSWTFRWFTCASFNSLSWMSAPVAACACYRVQWKRTRNNLSSFRRSYWTSSSLALLRCLVSSGTKVRVERPKAGRARQWMFVKNKYEKKSPLRHSYTHEKASCIWDTIFHISHTSSWRPQILLLFTPLLCVYYTIILYLSFVSIFLA